MNRLVNRIERAKGAYAQMTETLNEVGGWVKYFGLFVVWVAPVHLLVCLIALIWALTALIWR